MKKRKLLKNTGVYINEDLTTLNQHILACIRNMRKKQPDEVEGAWSIDGHLFYNNKTGTIHRVWYENYQTWIDLRWPEPVEKGSIRSGDKDSVVDSPMSSTVGSLTQ